MAFGLSEEPVGQRPELALVGSVQSEELSRSIEVALHLPEVALLPGWPGHAHARQGDEAYQERGRLPELAARRTPLRCMNGSNGHCIGPARVPRHLALSILKGRG